MVHRAVNTPATMKSEMAKGEYPAVTSLVGASAAPSQTPAVSPQITPRPCSDSPFFCILMSSTDMRSPQTKHRPAARRLSSANSMQPKELCQSGARRKAPRSDYPQQFSSPREKSSLHRAHLDKLMVRFSRHDEVAASANSSALTPSSIVVRRPTPLSSASKKCVISRAYAAR